MLQNVMRPQIGTDVENAVVERPAEVQAEKPDIMKTGEEAILPAAEKPAMDSKPKNWSKSRSDTRDHHRVLSARESRLQPVPEAEM